MGITTQIGWRVTERMWPVIPILAGLALIGGVFQERLEPARIQERREPGIDQVPAL